MSYDSMSLSKLQSLYAVARSQGDHASAEEIGAEIDSRQRHWSYDL